jgi:transcriptional regulator GlxA family with amidase domain
MTNEVSQAAAGTSLPDGRPPLVAILLFDDVEVLDFAGPFEVFAVATTNAGATAFDVATVSLDGQEIIARNGLRVTPSHSSSAIAVAEILVVPGGFGTRREMTNPAMLSFLRDVDSSAHVTLSVCTGALLLGAAGLLKGKGATTHWSAMDELRALPTGAEILPDARIVDNGRLVVSAGVSAGIDAALHIVCRLLGQGQAEVTAREMDYDWTYPDKRTVVRASSEDA